MDIQRLFTAMGEVMRGTRAEYHLTLGELIALLERTPETLLVEFDTGMGPSDPHSYRGYYDDLALQPSPEPIMVGAFLRMCRAALGAEFTGYKGGEFSMDAATPLWAARYGDCGRAIVGVETVGEKVVLKTKTIN